MPREAIVVFAIACSSPQLEGVYGVDEIPVDNCDMTDRVEGGRLVLTRYGSDEPVYGIHGEELNVDPDWIGEVLRCTGDGEDPVSFLCVSGNSGQQPSFILRGEVFAEEGRLLLRQRHAGCDSRVKLSWRRKARRSDGEVFAPVDEPFLDTGFR